MLAIALEIITFLVVVIAIPAAGLGLWMLLTESWRRR